MVQFGNGEILADGRIGNSKELIGLSSDIGKVMKTIEDVNFLKGITNMAQAAKRSQGKVHGNDKQVVVLIARG